MPGLEVTMQGSGPLEAELQALTVELGLEPWVKFAPFVHPRKHVKAVIGVMSSAELVCLPSKSESFGLVMIEALAAGAPVVGFGPTLREIQDRVGIDVGEPLDDPTPENVAAAIESVRSRQLGPGAAAQGGAVGVLRRVGRAPLREAPARSQLGADTAAPPGGPGTRRSSARGPPRARPAAPSRSARASSSASTYWRSISPSGFPVPGISGSTPGPDSRAIASTISSTE